MTPLGAELLGAGKGAEAKLGAFITHTGTRPDTLAEIEDHLTGCPDCQREVALYLQTFTRGTYINDTGWWDMRQS